MVKLLMQEKIKELVDILRGLLPETRVGWFWNSSCFSWEIDVYKDGWWHGIHLDDYEPIKDLEWVAETIVYQIYRNLHD